MKRVWYSYQGIPYKGNCPAYYDLREVDWFKRLSDSQKVIKELALEYLKNEGVEIERYFNETLVRGEEQWKISPFLFWGRRNERNIDVGKELFKYFDSIPGLVGLAISILPAHTAVKPHYGDTDAVYRIHIPVFIPSGLPKCGLKVNGIERSWTENQPIVFCDAHLHEAWNYSEKTRLVIIADVLRAEFASMKTSVCKNVLSLLKLQQLLDSYSGFNLLPGPLKGLLRLIIKYLIL